MRSMFSSLFTKLPNSPRFYLAVVLLLVLAASPVLPAQSPRPASPAPAAQAPSQPAGDQSATIRGVVLSTVDKKPIPGVQVTIYRSDRAAMTDDKGQFVFTAIPLGYVTVNAEKPGFLCYLTQSNTRPNCSQFVDLRSNDGDVTLTMNRHSVALLHSQREEPADGLEGESPSSVARAPREGAKTTDIEAMLRDELGAQLVSEHPADEKDR